jgi:hypothetical protein
MHPVQNKAQWPTIMKTKTLKLSGSMKCEEFLGYMNRQVIVSFWKNNFLHGVTK